MGTRNLTFVQQGGTYKVAQYCQWDGYPSGQGMIALRFIREPNNLQKLRESVPNLKQLTDEEYSALWKECGADGSGWVGCDVSDKFKAKHPHLHRDCGADILGIIAESGGNLGVRLDEEFAADSLFCEWAYVIDLDANTFEVYKGFNQDELPSDERFAKLNKDGEEYRPIKLCAKWDLDSLPTDEEFLSIDKEDEEE